MTDTPPIPRAHGFALSPRPVAKGRPLLAVFGRPEKKERKK